MILLTRYCILAFLLPYSAAASAACADGNCYVPDETNLMQLRQTVKAGMARLVEDQDQDWGPAPEDDAAAAELDKMVEHLLGEVDLIDEVGPNDHEQSSGIEYPNPPNQATPPSNGRDMLAPKEVLPDAASLASEADKDESDAEEEDETVLEDETASEETLEGVQRRRRRKVPSLPSKCTSYGPCLGVGPYCTGNAMDCENMGMKAIGFVLGCPGDKSDVCQSGYKVQCATCAADQKSETYPQPAPLPSPFVPPPPPPTTAPGPTPSPPSPIVVPTNMPVFPAATYDPGLVGNATLALKNAHALLKSMRAQLNNISCTETAIKKNISMFAQQQRDAKAASLRDRSASVKFAKKKQLANITLVRVQQNINDAFFAQKGTEQGAITHYNNARSANRQWRYYKKQCISLKYQKQQVYQNLTISQDAVRKARSDLAIAKSDQSRYQYNSNSNNIFKRAVARSGTKWSQRMSVKSAEEKAFAAGSIGRNASSDVPPWGNNWYR